jgi:N-acetylmuramate 1-kinase
MMHEPDERAASALQWARRELGVDGGQWAPASADASFRRYFRLRLAHDSVIVMDAPPAQEDCRPFIAIAGLLKQAGLHVPTVRSANLDQGFLLLDDLGTDTWLQAMPRDPEAAWPWFEAAIAALVRLQGIAPPADLPHYDRALLQRELDLFPDWYVARHLQRTLSPAARDCWADTCQRLIDSALAQPTVLVHRDFMPRNLMVSTPNPGILDFQDAVAGPISYDVISLFKDAFISWPQTLVDRGLAHYWQAARSAGLPVPDALHTFHSQAERMGTQRHLKVLGIFARIAHRDGKPKYLQDAPRFLGYLRQRIAADPVLAPLSTVLDELEADA